MFKCPSDDFYSAWGVLPEEDLLSDQPLLDAKTQDLLLQIE